MNDLATGAHAAGTRRGRDWAETGQAAGRGMPPTPGIPPGGRLRRAGRRQCGDLGAPWSRAARSARRVPGCSGSPAGGFGAGQPLDIAPGGSALLGFAERVADDEERLGGATDDEIVGLICALDRAEASACFLKHAAVAEFIR